MKVIGRSAGRSAVAAAAYRSGECLYDERTQTTHDYTRRSGVEAAFIVAPAHAPEWAKDTGKLWNAAEAAERKSNSQLAREWEIALPAGVGAEGREEIARGLAEHLVERYGVAANVALHAPSRHGDDRNYHAHILTTTRRMEADGLGEKTRELVNIKTGAAEISHIREYAAELINAALAASGSGEQVDHRSFKDRGIEQTPTEHLGVEAAAMERRGEVSRIGEFNRAVEQTNQSLDTLTQEREALDIQIAEAGQPTQKTKATYWQDLITAERKGDNEGGTTAPLTPEHETLVIFDEPSLIQHKAQILEDGAVKHHGLLKSWVEHALDWVHHLGEDIGRALEEYELVADKPEPQEREAGFWQILIGRGKKPNAPEPQENLVNEITETPNFNVPNHDNPNYSLYRANYSEGLDRGMDYDDGNDIER